MTIRTDQLPHDSSWMARAIAEIRDVIAQLRAHSPDMSAADALLAPAATDITQWPQTGSTSYAAISRSYNVAWKQRLRIVAATTTSGGSTGTVRVSINGSPWGTAVTAGTTLDITAALPAAIAIGDQYQIGIEAVRTSGTGAVHAQVQHIRAID
ncbi:hypothetical protein [Kitasatospora sp. NPDC005751]|uniref:hypothetical protein n=1 Tax=Kitasatospora sp. NPDC005751 TaxID=3157064 RepID=UPI0033D3333F